ncbi:MAG: PilZ domain-containing protein [Deltaproteobacteria bacterium]|nr:PilZ domain-containing protein [Deltaproteobacteria bacterium]
MSEKTAERRRDRRVPVELWIEAEAGDELYFHRAANLSVGGAYFDKTIPEPTGKVVQLRFALPGGDEIACKGEIVTAQDFAMGVKFLDLSEDDRLRIENLVQKLGG